MGGRANRDGRQRFISGAHRPVRFVKRVSFGVRAATLAILHVYSVGAIRFDPTHVIEGELRVAGW